MYYSFDELRLEIEIFIQYYNEQRIKEKFEDFCSIQASSFNYIKKTRQPRSSRKKV
ncbi:hypothetical protein [Bulleidia sp. zg-1006]|uniref:hypothetical protein n=1 Tax=Bulleidia sp. zg-1006 TaxID=2806552 RepID=UPI00351C0DCC